MKLRIRGNSIRLRLLQGEIKALGASEQVKETTRLGPGSQDIFVYSLALHQTKDPVLIRWTPPTLCVTLSQELVKELTLTDRVSIAEEIIFGDSVLKVLIEKDFSCLTSRKDEDESDHFENPQESHLYSAK